VIGRQNLMTDAKATVTANHYRKPTVEEVSSDNDDGDYDEDDEQQIKRPYGIESPGMLNF
jgi:hypothetical protein